MAIINMIGWKNDYIEVIERAENNKNGDAMWKCKCRCGNVFVTKGSALRSGHCKSCGCYHKEKLVALKTTHGKTHTRLHDIWHNMKARCNNPNAQEYELYGGKGVKVCEEWEHDFAKFERWALNAGYDDSLTIDRIDISKGYSPENCKWSTRTEQNRNTSRTYKIWDGDKFLTAAEVGRLIGVGRCSVAKWCREEGITTLEQAIKRRDAIHNGMFIKEDCAY